MKLMPKAKKTNNKKSMMITSFKMQHDRSDVIKYPMILNINKILKEIIEKYIKNEGSFSEILIE